MSSINPFATAILQSPHAQEPAAAERVRESHRARAASRAVATADDELEHQVGGTADVAPIHDEHPDLPRPKKRPPAPTPGDDEADDAAGPHIDVKA